MPKKALTTKVVEKFMGRVAAVRVKMHTKEEYAGRADRISIEGLRGVEITKLVINFQIFFRIHEVTKYGSESENHWEPIQESRKVAFSMEISEPWLREKLRKRIVIGNNGDSITISHRRDDVAFFNNVEDLYSEQ